MKNNRKGFTLVELVIVIAVIAILSAVLVPTFSSVIEEAKKSSATQRARHCLTNYFSIVGPESYTDDIDTVSDLRDYIIIAENGTGKSDYKFIVQADGSLGNPLKVNHDLASGSIDEVLIENYTLDTTHSDTSSGPDMYKIDGCYVYIPD